MIQKNQIKQGVSQGTASIKRVFEKDIEQKKIQDLTIEEFVSIFSKYDVCRGYDFIISFAKLMEQNSKLLDVTTKDFVYLNCTEENKNNNYYSYDNSQDSYDGWTSFADNSENVKEEVKNEVKNRFYT